MTALTSRMPRTEVLELLRRVRLQADSVLPKGDPRRDYVLPELDRIEVLIENHFPLTDGEKKTIHIGLYAAREIETLNDKLAEDIQTLNYQLVYL